jgi:hypothetical protein
MGSANYRIPTSNTVTNKEFLIARSAFVQHLPKTGENNAAAYQVIMGLDKVRDWIRSQVL